jgi:glutaredoxin
VKEFLHRHGVGFVAHDVAEHPDAFDRIRAHTGGAVGTPTVVIGDEARIGFHPDWMAERLGLQRM